MVRTLPVFDHLSETNLHLELEFTNAGVPVINLPGEEGRALPLAKYALGQQGSIAVYALSVSARYLLV